MATLKKQLEEAQKLKDQAEKAKAEAEKAKAEAEKEKDEAEQHGYDVSVGEGRGHRRMSSLLRSDLGRSPQPSWD